MGYGKYDILYIISIILGSLLMVKIGMNRYIFIIVGLFILGIIYRVYKENKKDPKS